MLAAPAAGERGKRGERPMAAGDVDPASVLALYHGFPVALRESLEKGKDYDMLHPGGLSGKLRRTSKNHVEFRLAGEHRDTHGIEAIKWNARANRKGRHPTVVYSKNGEPSRTNAVMPLGRHLVHTIHKRPTILLTVEPGNISWWVAHIFTWGSILWVVNGIYVMWPQSSGTAATNDFYVAAWSAFWGALVFEFGAYAAVLEAINVDARRDFGYHLLNDFHRTCSNESENSDNFSQSAATAEATPTALLAQDEVQALLSEKISSSPMSKGPNAAQWRWYAFDLKPIPERSALIQFFGANLFLISSTLALPNYSTNQMLIPNSYWVLQDIFIWLFQVIGSLCFLYGAIILMLEAQVSPSKPNWTSVGWHVCVWNAIGALGFLLCALFGFLANVNGEEICCQHWGTAFSTFWGSIGFLVGSLLSVYEVSNRWTSESSV